MKNHKMINELCSLGSVLKLTLITITRGNRKVPVHLWELGHWVDWKSLWMYNAYGYGSVYKVTPTAMWRRSVRYASESQISECTLTTHAVTVGKWPYCGRTLWHSAKQLLAIAILVVCCLLVVDVVAAVVVTVLQPNKTFHLNLALKRRRLWSSCLAPEQTMNICTQTCRTVNAIVAQSKKCPFGVKRVRSQI
jgi:hypothetical protein